MKVEEQKVVDTCLSQTNLHEFAQPPSLAPRHQYIPCHSHSRKRVQSTQATVKCAPILVMSVSLYPLASLEQIEKSPSREDGIPEDLEEDLRAFGCKLIHQAGILLKQ